MSYEIAIPSYKRAGILAKATIPTLLRLGADKKRITIWVANLDELVNYRQQFGDEFNIEIAQVGKVNAQRFYHKRYATGTPILNLDDDIYNIQEKDGEKLKDYEGTIDQLAEIGFAVCEKSGARLWGEKVTEGSSGDDYETTLRSYILNGSVVRIDYLCPITKYFAEGGIDAELKARGIEDRQTDHQKALFELADAYPDLAKTYTKSNGILNLRLKTITQIKLSKP